MDTTPADGPLGGIRVLDLTNVIMGPFATHILADLGADVIKVESAEGDSFRSYRPNRNEGMAGGFIHLNRNKRSIVLDLKHPADLAALQKLITTADVFVHSLRPKAIEKLGLSYAAVREVKPDIIYCGAYGFGEKGPIATKQRTTISFKLVQVWQRCTWHRARSRRSCQRCCATNYRGRPSLIRSWPHSFNANAAVEEQAIEVPMFETTAEFAYIEHLLGFSFEPPLGPPGYTRVVSPRRKPFRTSDGYMCILPYSDRNWRDFFDFVGRPEIKDDPRFYPLTERVAHLEELYELIEQEAPKHSMPNGSRSATGSAFHVCRC